MDQSIFNQEKLIEKYATLPDSVKRALFSVNTADIVMKLGQKFGLNVEQTGKLAETTGLVMLGALHPRSYIQKLEETLGIDRGKAVDIAKDVNHEIFFPIRESLKKIHGMEETADIASDLEREKGDILKKLAEMKEKERVTPKPQPVLEQKPAEPIASPPKPPIAPPPIPKPSETPSAEKPAPEHRRALETLFGPGGRLNIRPQEIKKDEIPAPQQPPPQPFRERRPLQEPIRPSVSTPPPQSATQKEPEKENPPHVPLTHGAPAREMPNTRPQTAPTAQPAPSPKSEAPHPIPEWAQPPKRGDAPSEERDEKQPLPQTQKTEIKKANQEPVQKVPMREIRPRPTVPPTTQQKTGPGGDRYREPIE